MRRYRETLIDSRQKISIVPWQNTSDTESNFMPSDRVRVDMQSRHITITDIDGEQTDKYRLDQVRKASKAYGRSWNIVFMDASRLLSKCPMSPAATSVLWWALTNLHPRDYTICKQQDIAKILGFTRSAIAKALIDLRVRGIICKGKSRGHYRLSLFIAWQGTAGAYQKERRKRNDEIILARAWHKANIRTGTDIETDFWRITDSPQGLAKKENVKRRGGEALSIGDIIGTGGIKRHD